MSCVDGRPPAGAGYYSFTIPPRSRVGFVFGWRIPLSLDFFRVDSCERTSCTYLGSAATIQPPPPASVDNDTDAPRTVVIAIGSSEMGTPVSILPRVTPLTR